MTVAALIENDGRFLMVQERIAGKSVYNQPAGHLEDGETLIEAVIRETREETAWHFEPEAVIEFAPPYLLSQACSPGWPESRATTRPGKRFSVCGIVKYGFLRHSGTWFSTKSVVPLPDGVRELIGQNVIREVSFGSSGRFRLA